MINLTNKDRTIHDLPLRVADIIKEYQDTGSVIIATAGEGLCLRSAGFYTVLDYVVSSYNMDKSKITIVTHNAEEQHPEYRIEVQGDHWIPRSRPAYEIELGTKIDDLKHIGCFVGKPNWHRLVLSAWLYNTHQTRCLQTNHYDPDIERHRIDSELTEINVQCPQELPMVIDFIKHCPIVGQEGFLNYTIGPPTHYNIIREYQNIFADLVIETYVSGISFFPTEKTLRPIVACTPFILMGPRGYLGNLSRMGFKTFNRWWDETYDDYSDYQRIQKIKQVVDTVCSWDSKKLHTALVEMAETLEHNRKHLETLTADAVKLDGK